MTVGYTARFVTENGAYALDVSSGRYALRNFIPPSAEEILQTASGLSSNRYGGGDLTGRRGANGTLEFEVKVTGTSVEETERAGADLAVMIRRGGYFEWVANGDITAQPLYGQGAWKRVHIVSGQVWRNELYWVGQARGEMQFYNVSLAIRPYILGMKQRLCFAAGGIFEDYIGDPLGVSLGLRVPEATVNKMTNPVLGHGTFGNGWTAGSAVTAAANYNKKFILFGNVSARLVTQNATSNNTYTQSINVGNTNAHTLSVYVKKADGTAVTSSDCRVFYGSGVASTYQSLGDGWYRVYAGVTGVSGATATGIELRAVGAGLYLAGTQIEEKAYPTLIAHGDMLGVAWTGTAHDSTSSRTAATLSVPTGSAINPVSGSARIALEMDCDQTCATFTVFKVYQSAAGLDCYYNATDDKFYLTDGTNTISSAAQTWSVGDKIVLHVTWKSGALAIYKNGSSIASGSTYTPPTAVGSVFILCDNAGAEQSRARLKDFTTWEQALTAAEVLNDYTNQATVLADGQRMNPVPWIHGYSAISPSNALTVAGGVPGNVDADTFWSIEHTTAAAVDLYISQCIAERYSGLTAGGVNLVYKDLSSAVSVSTTGEFVDSSNPVVLQADIENYAGKKAWIAASLIDAGSALYGAAVASGLGATVVGDYRAVAAGTAYKAFFFGPVRMPMVDDVMKPPDAFLTKTINLYLRMIRSTGSAANVTPNWMQVLPERLCKFDMTTGILNATYRLLINGRKAVKYNTATGNLISEVVTPIGDLIELGANGQINHLMLFGVDDGGLEAGLAHTIAEVSVVPRWVIG